MEPAYLKWMEKSENKDRKISDVNDSYLFLLLQKVTETDFDWGKNTFSAPLTYHNTPQLVNGDTPDIKLLQKVKLTCRVDCSRS